LDIHWIDLLIVIGYLLGITAVGLAFSRRQTESSTGYFLAGRSLGWVPVGLALFATNISTVHLIGLASSGFSDGLVIGNFEWLAPFCLILLGLFFAPFYFKSKISTLPEYLEKRYGPSSRTALAFMAVIGSLFIHIGVTLYAGAVMFQNFVDIDIVYSILVVSVLTVVYTVLGGLKAVVVTESIQTVLLLVGALTVTLFGVVKLAEKGTSSLADLHRSVLAQEAADARTLAAQLRECAEVFRGIDALQGEGGPEAANLRLAEVGNQLRAAHTEGAVLSALEGFPRIHQALLHGKMSGRRIDFSPATGALLKQAALHQKDADTFEKKSRSKKLRMVQQDGTYAWWIMLLGYPIIGIWYWCADQTIVQRVLGARSRRDAQIGPIFCGFIKVLPVFLMVMPGVIGYVLFKDVIGEQPDSTLIVLIKELLPTGLQGLMIAGLLAALMSTVAGALNSTATLVSIDIVKRLRPDTGDRALVRIGQVTAVAVMILAMAWSTQGERFGGIFSGINHMISVLSPPISVVFIWGILWRRGTARASLITLVAGLVLGGAVFIIDFPAFGFEILSRQWQIPFLLQAWWLFVACSVVFVISSLLTPPPDPDRVERYCWANPLAAITERPFTGLADPRSLAVLLVMAMAICYTVFG